MEYRQTDFVPFKYGSVPPPTDGAHHEYKGAWYKEAHSKSYFADNTISLS